MYKLSVCSLFLRLSKLSAAIKRLEGMGASSFVLDLRDNLGGLVQVLLYPFFDLVELDKLLV